MASVPPFIGGEDRPPLPPELPTLSSYPMPMDEEAEEGEGVELDGVITQVYEIERQLDDLARAIPGSSERIDNIKTALREVMAITLRSQSGGQLTPKGVDLDL